MTASYVGLCVKMPFGPWLPPFISILMNGIKDKNSSVRAGVETAIAYLCRFNAPKQYKDFANSQIILQVL